MAGRPKEMGPAEAGAVLRVSPATVRRYETRGLLPRARRLPDSRYRRYPVEAVEELAAILDRPDSPGRDIALAELRRRNLGSDGRA